MESYMPHIWFLILRQLGFDPNKIESIHKLKVHENMFKTANPRGLEVVIHFLLNKLDPAKSRDKFKPCWPIQDKNEERQFRKLCIDWLNELGAAWPILGFTTTRKPSVILLNPIGDKVYRFLFNFGYCVFLTQINSFPHRYKHAIPNIPFHGNESKHGILTNGAIRASQAMTIDNMRQFLWWLAQQHKLNTTCLASSQEYCNEIKNLRKSNRECQKIINEKLSILPPENDVLKRSNDRCLPEILSNIDFLSLQMSQLTNSLEKFALFCDDFKSTLSFGDKAKLIDGKQLEIKLEDPILSSYEKLYRNGRIGAIYSDRDEICFGPYLQLGKLSLVTTDDVLCQENGRSMFDKWNIRMKNIEPNSSIALTLVTIQSEMALKHEPRDIEHYTNKIRILQDELMNCEESHISNLLIPPNLAEKFDQMMGELFNPTSDESFREDFATNSNRTPQYDDTTESPHPDNTLTINKSGIALNECTKPKQTGLSKNNSIGEISEPERTTPLIEDKNSKQGREMNILKVEDSNKCAKIRKATKTKDQIFDDLVSKISTAMMSNDPNETEPQYFDDPIEAFDEVSAFQSKDNITRTPDARSLSHCDTRLTQDLDEVTSQLYPFATQSPDTQSPEIMKQKISNQVHPFLSPLKDDDLS